MRVSDAMLGELNRAALAEGRAELAEAQRASSTGVRVAEPSDDPVLAARARQSRSTERRAEAIRSIASRAVTTLSTVDGVLGQVTEALSRARELAVQGGNDTLAAGDRAALAKEVRALRSQLIDLANTRVDGEYVFGGLAVDRPPFDATGAFQGSTVRRQLAPGPGVRLDVQLPGDAIFGVSGGVDTFAALDALATALDADDGPAVRGAVAGLEGAVEQVADGRATLGVQQEALLQAEAVAGRVRDDAIAKTAGLVEADPLSTFTDLVKAENALRQAIAVAGRLTPSLLGGGA
ncbi:MAG: flagellar hook-associated protein FlgL [Sandaracinaceae bacterium]